WYRAVGPTQLIQSPLGTVRVRGAVHTYSPGDLGSALPPIALLCLVFGLLAFLVGPRARTLLVGLVLAGAVAIVVLSFVVHKPVVRSGTIQSAPGRLVTPLGGAVAL